MRSDDESTGSEARRTDQSRTDKIRTLGPSAKRPVSLTAETEGDKSPKIFHHTFLRGPVKSRQHNRDDDRMHGQSCGLEWAAQRDHESGLPCTSCLSAHEPKSPSLVGDHDNNGKYPKISSGPSGTFQANATLNGLESGRQWLRTLFSRFFCTLCTSRRMTGMRSDLFSKLYLILGSSKQELCTCLYGHQSAFDCTSQERCPVVLQSKPENVCDRPVSGL